MRLEGLGIDIGEPGEAEIDAVVDRIVIDERAAALDVDRLDVVRVERQGWVIPVGDVDLADHVLGNVEVEDPRRLRKRLNVLIMAQPLVGAELDRIGAGAERDLRYVGIVVSRPADPDPIAIRGA